MLNDVHSYANIAYVRVTHLDLDLNVSFENKAIEGVATLSFEKTAPVGAIVLDTRGLTIEGVEVSADGTVYEAVPHEVGEADPILGAPLRVETAQGSGRLRVRYRTGPDATALQWLTPAQTSGKRHPFLFTQSQAIHARSWIPLQDSPSVKTTYSARIHTPRELRALMSAPNAPDELRDGEYEFRMMQPIPSYLLALAVGDLEFRPIGARTGVWAESEVVDRAAAEFEDTERMLVAAEKLFGPYEWGRYEILVLPPSFPYGGMENPRLTFATPTILAGDKSLVALVAHELAHSWSGNLVTNATWSDFWLNEGFTVYLELRITEAVYGRNQAAMQAVLMRQELDRELARLDDRDEILHVDLDGRDPDDGFTEVPYNKGALFLKTLEAAYGREALDEYLRAYFGRFPFKSLTTAQFEEDLQVHLLNAGRPSFTVPIKEWLYEPGVPEGAWQPQSEVFSEVERAVQPWLDGNASAASMPAAKWSTQEWLHFLQLLPKDIGATRLGELDGAFHLTRTGNSEILCEWLVLSIKNQYEPAYPRVREFLTSMGRRKFLRPLYEELARTEQGKQLALSIYRQARPTYHPISVAAVDGILGYEQ